MLRIEIVDLSKARSYDRKTICTSKRRYDLIDSAYAAICEIKPGGPVTIYKCPVCNYWHFGNKGKYFIKDKPGPLRLGRGSPDGISRQRGVGPADYQKTQIAIHKYRIRKNNQPAQ